LNGAVTSLSDYAAKTASVDATRLELFPVVFVGVRAFRRFIFDSVRHVDAYVL